MHTEILATMGPASIDVLPDMMEAGLNHIRINSSHGNMQFHQRAIREARKTHSGCMIIFDIKGPKIRIGDLPEPLFVHPGMELVLRTDLPIEPGTEYPRVSDFSQGLPITTPELEEAVKPGHRLMVDDGYVGLTVVGIQTGRILCEVMYGNKIRSRKGLNHPDTIVNFPYTMPHDKPLISFAVRERIHFIADSFTRNAEDVLELKHRLKETGIRVISKVENPEALRAFDEILEVTDAVMIARGDLGVEIDPWLLPEYQKTMIEKCNEAGKPVITATQMLESMIDNPHPSRSDVSDIANAIYDGTDVIMLSGETSIGKYPVKCVEMMRRIAIEVEGTARYRHRKAHVNSLCSPGS
ncbi:pyruvate kinase [bacterium]|nr:pyruvate kinase [bacterium]